MKELIITLLFSCMFLLGMATGVVIGESEVRNTVVECEKSLPRNQTCKAVIQAVPNEVKL